MPPVPIARDQNAVPVSVMDCIRRGGSQNPAFPRSGDTPDLDDQRYETIAKQTVSERMDSKLLWVQDLIPHRTITCWGPVRVGSSAGTFAGLMQATMDDPTWWTRSSVSSDGVTFSAPQWGLDYFRPSDLGFNILGPGTFESNTSYLWSGYQYGFFGGTFLGTPNPPIDLRDLLLIGGMLTQIMCPKPWKPLSYELWTVTTRWGIVDDADRTPFGVVPSPFPWSSSTDFQKQKAGVLNPGQTLIIPCPIQMQPAPPAPNNFIDPPAGINEWSGWGVSQYIVFP